MLKLLSSVRFIWAVALLLFSGSDGFIGVSLTDGSWLSSDRFAVVDRSIADPSMGYYNILPVDRTAFSVNYPVWLQQLDISKIFINNGSCVDTVPVKIKIVEKYLSDMRDKDVVYVGQVTLNSANETNIQFSPDISLQSKFTYEIRLAVPEMFYAYTGNLNIKEYRIKRFAWRSVILTFYQNNAAEKPPNSINEWTVSHGMVKRLHLKYPQI